MGLFLRPFQEMIDKAKGGLGAYARKPRELLGKLVYDGHESGPGLEETRKLHGESPRSLSHLLLVLGPGLRLGLRHGSQDKVF